MIASATNLLSLTGTGPLLNITMRKTASVKRCVLGRRGHAVSCSVITVKAATWEAGREKRSLSGPQQRKWKVSASLCVRCGFREAI